MNRITRTVIVAATALLVFLPAGSAGAVGKSHHGVAAYTLTNGQNPDLEQQKVTVYVNTNDFTQEEQSIFNFDTDEGPCGAARIYVVDVKLHRLYQGQWIVARDAVYNYWIDTSGGACPSADQYVNTPWYPFHCDSFYADVTFKVDWGPPIGNIGPYLIRASNVWQAC